MSKVYVTRSGARYLVDEDNGTWRKNDDAREYLMWLKALNVTEDQTVMTWTDVEAISEDRAPVVGERIYIGSHNVWWLSTPVVRIENVSQFPGTEESEEWFLSKAKILFWDSEWTPALSYTWGSRPKYLPNDFLVEPARMLCWGARWYGAKKVIVADERSGRREMLEGIRDLLSEADMVVSYNGASFDTKKLNSELMAEGLLPPAPYKEIDLYRVVRKNTAFYSGKLDFVSETVMGQRKVDTGGFQLWLDVMAGDSKAWVKMLRYQRQDVNLLVDLFEELRPWIKMPHPISDDPFSCHNCGGTDLRSRGYVRTLYSTYNRLRCEGCGKWMRGTERSSVTEVRSV